MFSRPRNANPICPYCDWALSEWADGKSKEREKIQCPNCEKKYFCVTYPVSASWGYEHRITKLGRKVST